MKGDIYDKLKALHHLEFEDLQRDTDDIDVEASTLKLEKGNVEIEDCSFD